MFLNFFFILTLINYFNDFKSEALIPTPKNLLKKISFMLRQINKAISKASILNELK